MDQEPNDAIYAPGYAFHQVKNSGFGLNIAWNVAIMCTQAINEMMAAYDFEVLKHKKIAMVPVLRVIHGLYFTHRHILQQPQLELFPQYLLKYLRIDKEYYDKAQSNRETKNRKIEIYSQ